MIYLLFFLLFLYPINIYDRAVYLDANKRPGSNKYYIFECIALILLFGLRNYVGGDTIAYMTLWNQTPELNEISLLNFTATRFMPFWYLLSSICKTINSEFWFFQLVHAVIVNSIIFYTIHKLTLYKFTAAFIYFIFAAFYFNCEIMRESIALCFFCLAMTFFIEKRWKPYLVLCFIGYMFHTSAILCFLYPLLYRFATNKISVKSLFVVIIASGVLFINPVFRAVSNMLPDALNLFQNDKYMELSNATVFGSIREILTSIIILIIIIRRDKEHDTKNLIDAGFKIYWLLITLGMGMHILTNRFSNYFKVYFIIVITQILWECKKKDIVIFLFLINIIFGVYRLYSRESSNPSLRNYAFYEQFYPYYSIFEDVPISVQSNRIQYMDK